MQGFDLQHAETITKREDDGSWVALNGLDDEPMVFVDDEGEDRAVEFLIVGAHSATYRKAERAEQEDASKQKKRTVSREESEARVRRIFAACVKDWRGVTDGGVPVPCTRDAVLKVLERAPWVYGQVVTAVQDHARFFTPASAS